MTMNEVLAELQLNRRPSVIYIPGHAKGDATHKDCERGMISSVNSVTVFVKFYRKLDKSGWNGTTAEACSPEDLALD